MGIWRQFVYKAGANQPGLVVAWGGNLIGFLVGGRGLWVVERQTIGVDVVNGKALLCFCSSQDRVAPFHQPFLETSIFSCIADTLAFQL